MNALEVGFYGKVREKYHDFADPPKIVVDGE
jgi:hypothetical protein